VDTLKFILKKYNLKGDEQSPIYLECNRFISFPRLWRQLGYAIGAEIGVARGKFSQCLLQHMPNLKLYAIDAWQAFDGYTDIRPQSYMEESCLAAREKLAPYNAEIIRDWSMNAVKRFKDESLDFVFIDAAHDYKNALDDIREWSKKVRKGGIVSGHDYSKSYRPEIYRVIEAVDDYVKEYKINPLFVYRKNDASWFFVK
jgi:hypothetical protein